MACSPSLKTLGAAIAALLAGSFSTASASLIVTLDPLDARFDSTTDDDSGGGGFSAGDPGGENSNGLTFNVTFTPVAGDLDRNDAAVNLIEVGGAFNGSGLYLLGGEIHFVSKMVAANSAVISTFNDLNWSSGNNAIGVRSGYGTLTVGTEYTVAAVFDPINSGTLEIGISDNGVAAANYTESFTLLNRGTRVNWSGNDSVTALRAGNISDIGGANTDNADPFFEDGNVGNGFGINGNPFEGTVGQALYWSLNGSIIVPEPTTAIGLLGIMLGAFLRRSRRALKH